MLIFSPPSFPSSLPPFTISVIPSAYVAMTGGQWDPELAPLVEALRGKEGWRVGGREGEFKDKQGGRNKDCIVVPLR